VDPVNRALIVLFADGPREIDVPPGCPITLRGERVRLRLVQARDRVRVTYVEFRESRVASAVEVQSGPPSPGLSTRTDPLHCPAPDPPASRPARPAGGTVPAGQ
jgi:hypothetical protein